MMNNRRTYAALSLNIQAQMIIRPARHVPETDIVFSPPKLTPAPSRCYEAGVSLYEEKTKHGHMAGG